MINDTQKIDLTPEELAEVQVTIVDRMLELNRIIRNNPTTTQSQNSPDPTVTTLDTLCRVSSKLSSTQQQK